MKAYILSLFAGILIGVIYRTISVRSPAPPLVALIGLFGILVGEDWLWSLKDKILEMIK